ncbi:MAG TPA: glycosyltransferase [bacterium]|nr:glycosyltransferase [bacterium]
MTFKTESVCVVIPVYNCASTISNTLESLKNQSVQPEEIIIAYNLSADNTLELIRGFSDMPNLRIVEVPENIKGPAGARNFACRDCHLKIIAFTDGDCVLPQNWIENIVLHFNEFDIGILTGPVKGIFPVSVFDKYQTVFGLNIVNENRIYSQLELFKSFGHTANMSVLKDVYIEIGGFNESLFYAEDHDFCYRILSTGKYKLMFSNAVEINHIFRTNLNKFIKISFNYNKAHSFLVSKFHQRFTVKFKNKKIIDFKFKSKSRFGFIFDLWTFNKKILLLIILSAFINPLFLLALFLYLLKIESKIYLKFSDSPLFSANDRYKIFSIFLLENSCAFAGEICGFFKRVFRAN